MRLYWRSRWLGIYLTFTMTVLALYFSLQYYDELGSFQGNKSKKIGVKKTFRVSDDQRNRLDRLKEFCEAHSNVNSMLKFARSSEERRSHFYVSHKKQFLYCSVPKVASTNWKRIILLLQGTIKSLTQNKKDDVHKFPQLKLFSILARSTVSDVIKNYFKFFIVRHPFERLMSGYRNKFLDKSRYFVQTYGSQILRLYRSNLTQAKYKSGEGVTFHEFVRWVIEKRVYDAHWAPVFKICYPCLLPFDFIGKMETLVADSETILRMVGADGVHFPANLTDGYSVSSRDLMYRYFSDLPGETIQMLYKIYEDDFKAFDYHIPERLFHKISANRTVTKNYTWNFRS